MPLESRPWRSLFDVPLTARSTGVPFIRAAAPSIEIICNSDNTAPLRLSFAQDVNDDVGGVIWDCGLLLVDYVISLFADNKSSGSCEHSHKIENVLDLGSGTGVAGIAAAINGATEVTLTDYKLYTVMKKNIEKWREISSFFKSTNKTCEYVQHTWGEDLPASWKSVCFDLLLASDVLYNSKCYDELEKTLRDLKFSCMITTYKRRHDDLERNFLERMESHFDIMELKKDDMCLKNVSKLTNMEGLHILQFTPR